MPTVTPEDLLLRLVGVRHHQRLNDHAQPILALPPVPIRLCSQRQHIRPQAFSAHHASSGQALAHGRNPLRGRSKTQYRPTLSRGPAKERVDPFAVPFSNTEYKGREGTCLRACS
jgi:hypothetical protein